MMHYGVQKLVAINSGNYVFAELDLGKPVHLAAPNNRGKSTLVNALQFLYIDDYSKMKFGKRSHEDTSRHYFGDENAYLVFECRTPSGPQCLLVRGLGNLRGGQFERYVYDGVFRLEDYINDDRAIRDFQVLRATFADRHLMKVKRSELWHVLGSTTPPENGKAAPRLNILPIRKREEYEAFRDVFARLLSLSAADARTLKQLIIDSHARDLGERRIDIAAEYRDDFERIERSDRELEFLRAVAELINKGRELRAEVASLRHDLDRSAPAAREGALQCHAQIENEQHRIDVQVASLEREREQLQADRDECLTAKGANQTEVGRLEAEWSSLAGAHDKWKEYRAPFIVQLRRELRQQNADVVELEQGLERASLLDVSAMERSVIELKQKVMADERALQRWQATAASELYRAGISDTEIGAAFRVLNPGLLNLIVGETVIVKDLDKAKTRIRGIANSIKENEFADDALVADISGIPKPDESLWRDPAAMQKQIAVERENLRRQESLLKVAKDQKTSREMLKKLNEKRTVLQTELAEYDRYSASWSNRHELETLLSAARKTVVETEAKQTDLGKRLRSNSLAARKTSENLQSLNDQKGELSTAAANFNDVVRRLNLDTGPLLSESVEQQETTSFDAAAVSATVANLRKLSLNAGRMEQLQSDLRGVQSQITDKSRAFEAQVCYCGDEDEEWTRLIDGHDSLRQREEANERNWDALIRTLGARLNGIVVAMRNIKLAVERLNAGLKNYQVSNLRAVEIEAQEVLDIYAPLEALAGADSLFQDREAIDFARLRLRKMIDANQIIELPALFEIRIRTQTADGTWQHAASLDEIGSTGTGMTAKAMIFVQLVRAVARDKKYRLHFYVDGLGELDDRNLSATAAMAVSQGITPITADPRIHLEPLAHPEVTVYSLGQDSGGRFFVDKYRTYHARRLEVQSPGSKVANE